MLTTTDTAAEIRERQAQAADAMRDLLRHALPPVEWCVWTTCPSVKAPLTGQISCWHTDRDYAAQREALHIWAGFLHAEVTPYLGNHRLQVRGTWMDVAVHIWTTTEEDPGGNES